MRLIGAVILGMIATLLAYYILKQRNPPKQSLTQNSGFSGERDADNTPYTIVPPITVEDDSAGSAMDNPDEPKAEISIVPPEAFSVQSSEEDITSSDVPPTTPSFREIEETPTPLSVEPRRLPGYRSPTGTYYSSTSVPLSKATVHCRDEGGVWIIYLKPPDDRDVAAVLHDGQQLAVDSQVKINRFTGQIVLEYEDGGRETVALSGSSPLYFRTNEDWEQDGTLSSNHADGYFVVIAPTEMDSEFSTSVHHYESCVDLRFHAHFIEVDKEANAGKYGSYPMTLEGLSLYDSADRDAHGELYVGQPPKLSVHNMITEARVVEETGFVGENRWGENFNPHTQSLSSVLEGREGRFTVRSYLEGSQVRHESKTFRYFNSFDSIKLDRQEYSTETMLTPDRKGKYQSAYLRFRSKDGIAKPVKIIDNPLVSVSPEGSIKIPPDPSIKRVTCEFSNSAFVVIDIPRVWWRLIDGDFRSEWNETKEMLPDEFTSKARQGAYIEMILPSSVNAIYVGFGKSSGQRVRKVKDSATIPLRDFSDDASLETAVLQKPVHLNAHIGELNFRLIRVRLQTCVNEHHWIIDSPEYASRGYPGKYTYYPTGYSQGVCKRCGAVKKFPNRLVKSSWSRRAIGRRRKR